MQKSIIRIFVLSFLVSLLLGFNWSLFFGKSTVRAVGDLAVDWGVVEGNPIFTVDNFTPGSEEVREVKIINNAVSIRPVGVRGIVTENLAGLAEKLWLTVSVDGADIYSGKLADFFNESSGPDGIMLFNLNAGAEKSLIFKVRFDPQAGNEFQGVRVVFDLHIGIAVTIPEKCLSTVFANDPIFGTDGNDNLRGTNGNDLIYGFEGDDRIASSNGNDCVIGGPGNDKINNSNGNDFLYGEEGNDMLNGSNGIDQLFGGSGNDTLKGSNGNDQLSGGIGDDILEGSNGIDFLYGDEGDDSLDGSNGNDKLIGGAGIDKLYGRNGQDECQGEIVNTCEL